MKVKELIEQLQKLDQEKDIVVNDSYNCTETKPNITWIDQAQTMYQFLSDLEVIEFTPEIPQELLS